MVRVKFRCKETQIPEVKIVIAFGGRSTVKNGSVKDRWCRKKHCVEFKNQELEECEHQKLIIRLLYLGPESATVKKCENEVSKVDNPTSAFRIGN